MSTLRWFLAVAALGVAMIWLWHETRPTAPTIASSSPAAHRDRVADVATRPVLAPQLRDVPAAPTDTFADDGEQLRARFANERTDASWASTTRAQLETDLGRFGGKDASVRTVECRTSMCRVEVLVASNDAGAAFVQSWLRERTYDGPGYVTQRDGTMVMYVGRTGMALLQ